MAKLFFLFSCAFMLCSNVFSGTTTDTKFIANVKMDSVMTGASGTGMMALAWDDRGKLDGRCDHYGYDFILEYLPKGEMKYEEAEMRSFKAREKMFDLLVSAIATGRAVDIWYTERPNNYPNNDHYNCDPGGNIFVIENVAIKRGKEDKSSVGKSGGVKRFK